MKEKPTKNYLQQGCTYKNFVSRPKLPSKKIERADRSDRIGEDFQLADRVEAAVQAGSDEEVEKTVFDELQKKRSEWTDVISEVDNLLKESENNED